MVELATIAPDPTPAIPCAVAGADWHVTLDRCAPAWLLRGKSAETAMPLPGTTSAQHDDKSTLLWLAPDAWLLLGDLTDDVRARLKGSTFDVSTRYIELRVTGDATGFTSRATGLSRTTLVPRRALPTRMAGLPVVIVPAVDGNTILAEHGRERYWIAWLERQRS